MKKFVLTLGMLLLAACRYYRFESRREQLPKSARADVIIVPGYELTDDGEANHILWNRVLMAKLWYDRGAAPRLIVTGGKPKRGITEAAKMAEIAVELGVPKDAVFIEPRATSSIENGRFGAGLMVAKGWRSALVVSDPGHLRYAIPVFRDAFNKRGLDLFWTPVDYELLRDHPQARHRD